MDSSASTRGGSRTAATSKMERFVIIVNGFQPLTIITKRSILDVAAALDPPLSTNELNTLNGNIIAIINKLKNQRERADINTNSLLKLTVCEILLKKIS